MVIDYCEYVEGWAGGRPVVVVALVEVRSTVTMPGWGEVRGGGHRWRPGRPWWVGSCCWWSEFRLAAARAPPQIVGWHRVDRRTGGRPGDRGGVNGRMGWAGVAAQRPDPGA